MNLLPTAIRHGSVEYYLETLNIISFEMRLLDGQAVESDNLEALFESSAFVAAAPHSLTVAPAPAPAPAAVGAEALTSSQGAFHVMEDTMAAEGVDDILLDYELAELANDLAATDQFLLTDDCLEKRNDNVNMKVSADEDAMLDRFDDSVGCDSK